jgi:hypothetical protein
MRLLRLLLLLGLFIAMFLWVRSAEVNIERKMNYSTGTKFNISDSVKCDSLSEVREMQPDLRPR